MPAGDIPMLVPFDTPTSTTKPDMAAFSNFFENHIKARPDAWASAQRFAQGNAERTGKEQSSAELIDCLTAVGDAAWDVKDWIPAKRAYSLVLEQDSENAHALNRLGRIALMSGDLEAASHHFWGSWGINLDPITAVNLAIVNSRCSSNFEMALYWCDRAIKIDDANCKPAYVQKAAIYDEQCEWEKSEAVILESLNLFPGDDDLLFALSTHQLRRGDFENGWKNYEHRAARLEIAAKLDEYPEWTGQPLSGNTLLVVREQGAGDQIMWARYLPLLVELGARVILFTTPELARLMTQSFPGIEIITSDREAANVEPDFWVAMGSLPLRCGKNARDGSPGWQDPYLDAGGPQDYWRALIPATGNLRVGLCWKGNPKHQWDRYRSLSWEQMKPLMDVPGVDFYSLQTGGTECPLVNLISYVHDFADTAAAIAHLDLVITVDTAVAHLAGAMGKRAWMLIGEPSDWRWGNIEGWARWYPSMRLFQSAIGSGVEQAMACLSNYLRDDVRDSSAPHEDSSAVTRSGHCRYGTMTWLRNDHYIGRSLALYGEYSESEAEVYRRVLKPGDVVVDAGANVGSETVALADCIGDRGLVYAFEPQPAYFSCMYANRGKYRTAIIAQKLALGADCRQIKMRSVEEKKIHAPGWESTGPEFTAEQVTVDYLKLSRCALIKVDVDGMEHEILRGAEQTIDRCRPLIYVEHDKPDQYPDMLPWLHAKGYRLYQHFAPMFNPDNFAGNKVNVFGSIVSAMVLCVPMERKDLHPTEWGLQRMRFE